MSPRTDCIFARRGPRLVDCVAAPTPMRESRNQFASLSEEVLRLRAGRRGLRTGRQVPNFILRVVAESQPTYPQLCTASAASQYGEGMPPNACVYILTNRPHGVLYTGVTSDLRRRLTEHRQHLVEGFTSKYNVTQLVWFSCGDSISDAIALEKKVKNRGRQWKITLIERENPGWNDLADSIL